MSAPISEVGGWEANRGSARRLGGNGQRPIAKEVFVFIDGRQGWDLTALVSRGFHPADSEEREA